MKINENQNIYLAKEGAKTDRVKEYELMKEKLDLKSCTFKPKILRNNKSSISLYYNTNIMS
jgi:hypothetical protein